METQIYTIFFQDDKYLSLVPGTLTYHLRNVSDM